MDDITIDIGLLDTNSGLRENVLSEAEVLLEKAGTDLMARSDAINAVCNSIWEMKDTATASTFIGYLSKKYKVSKKTFNDIIKGLDDESKRPIKPEKYTLDDAIEEERKGWFIRNNCYYFITKEGLTAQGSNFIINPLFHIYSKIDNKRLIEIVNEDGLSRIIDIPSKGLINVDQFTAYVFNEGDFIWKAPKSHYVKIIQVISKNFPLCHELQTLGWRKEGFWAFPNGIYNGQWQPVSNLGITTHLNRNYFSPAFSVVYKDITDEDDEYENDRFLIYNQAPCTFGEWTKLMTEVYEDNSYIGLAFTISTCFRDFIFNIYKCFPHLFLFGEVQSGKSQLAWSLSNLFFHNQPAFNLTAGTNVGMSRKAARAKNCVVWLDEYNNDIDPRRFQLLKSAFDGAGHEKGKMTQDTRTKTDKINGSFCISGQFLPTNDDNSLMTRSCMLNFSKRKYSKEQMNQFDALKKLEEHGISSLICDIVDFRPLIESQFAVTFSKVHDTMKMELMAENKSFNERLLRNYCLIITPVKIIMDSEKPLELNFTWKQLYDSAKQSISQMSKQISGSESIAGFWNTVEYLLDKGDIAEGIDFNIKDTATLKFIDKNGNEKTRDFIPPDNKLLFIRFSKIHPLYMEKHRQQTGKNGVDLVSIMHYLQNHKSFVGRVTAHRFDTSNTSAYVFMVGKKWLDINLERTVKIQFNSVSNGNENNVPKPSEPDQVLFDLNPEPPF